MLIYVYNIFTFIQNRIFSKFICICVQYNMEHRNEKHLKRMVLVSVGSTQNGLVVQSCVITNPGLGRGN